MRSNKKSKAEVFPNSEYMLYKSTQLKDPHYIKNRHMITRNSSKGDTLFAKSVSVKHSVNKTFDSFKDKYSQISLENSSLEYRPIKPNKKVSTQKTLTQSQSRNGHYRIEDLLGINTKRSKKGSNVDMRDFSHKSPHTQHIQDAVQSSFFEINKLRKQNQQLMRVNEQLLYQKEYFKQKVILQQVEIRDLNRKLVDAKQHIFIPKSHHKKKSSLTQQSQLSFKVRQKQQLSSHRIQRAIFQIHSKPVPVPQIEKESKVKNFDLGLEKSSLLISESEQDRHPLKDRSSNQNINFRVDKPNTQILKTQKQFSQLLESVQNQNNQNRKMTLRKMLAIKAMELKKVKQKV